MPIIRLLHISTTPILPMTLSLVMGYAIHTQFSRIWFSVLQIKPTAEDFLFSEPLNEGNMESDDDEDGN